MSQNMFSLQKFTFKQYCTALIIWTVIVLTLLLMPSSSFSHAPKLLNIPHSDKIAHFVLFSAESFLLFMTLKLSDKKNFSNLYIFTTGVIFIFGLLTEILQGLMYNTAKRNFSLGDLAFDTLACIAAMLFLYWLNKRKK